MTWVRLDDSFTSHPKVVAAGPLAIAMQVAALCYCNRELTDGFVPRAVARTLLDWQMERDDGRVYTIARTCGMAGDDVDSDWVIALLVDVGMWEQVSGGYRIHDYLDYQPSRAQIEEERAKKVEAGRRGGLASVQARAQARAQADATAGAQAKSKQKSTPVPKPVPVGSNEPTSPPTPPPTNGAAPESSSFAPTYTKTLGKTITKVSSSLRELDVGLTDGWLRTVLAEIERDVGHLPRDKLQDGLHIAYSGLQRALEAERAGGRRIANIRGLSRKFLLDALKEQADADVA